MHVQDIILLILQIAKIPKNVSTFFVLKRIQLLSVKEANILLRGCVAKIQHVANVCWQIEFSDY